ncbi:MAG: transcription termination factor Rho [Opitutae bacterium]|nr:transcription termination factor Rho [Opitutae bacterium]
MPTNKKPKENESVEVSSEKSESNSLETQDAGNVEKGTSGGQLFFSTDGEDSAKPEENPYLEEKESTLGREPSEQPSKATQPVQGEKPQHPQKGPTNQGNGHGQKGGGGGRKQNWQDKKRQKPRPRQKFKKPRKLPFEETEVRPLEIGELLENELIRTESGLSSLAEEFAGVEDEPLVMDELLPLNLHELKEKVLSLPFSIELPSAPLREEILDILLENCLVEKKPVRISGILQVMEDGHGFLLQQFEDYRLKSQCPFVPQPLIKKFGLKTGQLIQGFIRAKMDSATCPILLQVEQVMAGSPEEASRVTPFTELIPYYPLERIFLETDEKVEWDNVSMRVVDLVSPVGFGQRGLIVAPPRTGKTVLQQGIARALRVNNPQAHLIVLLVDERPEEVTDFRRQVPDAEVIASTFDEPAESHVHAAEIVIEKARRMVEHNQDVVILLDSITRLARAYNTTMPNSGKILSGGVEASALQRPKRFFGSARNIEEGGSLTILGTALVETGSKMDEVIFEEFKGTGNMELHLDRELSNKRIFPALDFEKSGTRKEELLYHPDELTKIYSLRRSLKGVPPAEAMEMFIQRVRKTKNNPEFLMGLGR